MNHPALGAGPPRGCDERTLLDGLLDHYRLGVLRKVAGLTAQQLVQRSCPPSTMSLIGLVRHLTEMERVYAQRLSEPDLPIRYVTGAAPDADFADIAVRDVQATC